MSARWAFGTAWIFELLQAKPKFQLAPEMGSPQPRKDMIKANLNYETDQMHPPNFHVAPAKDESEEE